MDNMGKAEKLKQLFALVFTSKTCSQTTVYISTTWRLEGQAEVGEQHSQYCLENLGVSRSEGLDEIFLSAERIGLCDFTVCCLFSLTNLVIGRGL